MLEIIDGKISVNKIAKEKLFKGKVNTYLDIVLIPSPNDQYGNDYMIVQSASKEERLAGKRGAILGNAKIIQRQQPPPEVQRPKQSQPPAVESNEESSESDDVPF